jgi:lysine 6-dehydrogenase
MGGILRTRTAPSCPQVGSKASAIIRAWEEQSTQRSLIWVPAGRFAHPVCHTYNWSYLSGYEAGEWTRLCSKRVILIWPSRCARRAQWRAITRGSWERVSEPSSPWETTAEQGGEVGYRYAVLGAGRQGTAAAYDMARFGEAEEVILIDIDPGVAQASAERVNTLLDRRVATAAQADINDTDKLVSVVDGVCSFLSAIHYSRNLALTEVAIRTGAHMCDLGGNTGIVRRQLARDAEAKAAGVTIVPDCGMGPGMNISLALYAMSLLDRPREVYIWDGGLPQDPEPPWSYSLTFHIDGLTNEYYGDAHFLRDGQVTPVPCFEGFEELDFPPPLGRLEAFVTSGGLSTAPWTFEGKLARLENKTLRYPGHWAQFRAFSQLGLFGLEPVQLGDVPIVPRDVFHLLLEPKIRQPKARDVCVIRTKCVGERDGRPAEATVELLDFYDEVTGFTAMQRLTGWHASIVAILAAQGRISRGATPIELAVPGPVMVREARRRGFAIKERMVLDEEKSASADCAGSMA